MVSGQQHVFAVIIKPLCAFQTLFLSPLSVAVNCFQGTASGYGLFNCTLEEASVWLLWAGLLPGCCAAMEGKLACLQCQSGGNERQAAYSCEGLWSCVATQGIRVHEVP